MSATNPPFTDEHEELRASARGFIERELTPHAQQWEQEQWFPDEVFSKARRPGAARAEVPRASTAGRAATTCTRRCSSRSWRASARAAPRPGSARTSTSPPRRSGSSAQRSRSSATSCPRSRGEKIGALGDHRAGRRLGRRRAAHARRAVEGGWLVNGEKTYITNGVRAHFIVTAVQDHRAGRPPRHLLPDHRPRRGGQLLEAREARLARLGHGHDQLRGRVRARGEPARRAQRGLRPDHGQLPVGAPGDGARRGRRDADRLGAHRRLRTRAPGVRPAPLRPPGDPPQARRPRRLDATAAAASPTTPCAGSSPARSRCAR